jgi:hypothetical protein
MRYEYPFHAISRDYLRAAFGFMFFALPAALMDLPRVSVVIFTVLAVLSLLYGFQTFRRQKTHVQICERGIEVAPGGIRLAWRELTKLALFYFCVRRDGVGGWMELKLASGRKSMRLDSRMQGFEEVAARAARAASENGLRLDQATVTNLAALGIRISHTRDEHVHDH